MGAKIREAIERNWRGFLARIPLPMLAIPASYGVFEFTHLFVPMWVAVIQAMAFEAVYVGLAAYDKLTEKDKSRAQKISMFAVGASIVYNSLAGYFHRSPQVLSQWESVWWGGLILAILHGAPLALLAYFVSNFTLHRKDVEADIPAQEPVVPQAPRQATFERKRKSIFMPPIRVKIEREPADMLPVPKAESEVIMESALLLPSPIDGLTMAQWQAVDLASKGFKRREIASQLNISAQAVSDRIANAKKANPKAVNSKLAKRKIKAL